MESKKRRPACKDCGSTTRKLSSPGPRCATCHRAERQRLSKAAHERRALAVYGLTSGTYDAILDAQNGLCAICQRARGVRRRLAIDHDHTCCASAKSCGQCVRGLLCSPCNDVLATARDDPTYFARAIQYLASPPAKAVINAAVSRVSDRSEGDEGGPVVQARSPVVATEVRCERNPGSEPLPGVDHYAAILDAAYRNTRDGFA